VRRRLDVELLRRGLTATRAEASQAIREGRVTVNGSPAVKAGTLVAPDEAVALLGPARRFASRGGDKLDAALDRFGVDPRGRMCLDAGASTGGFTDCLLRRGAARVLAVDVGYGQLAWALREDPRVTVLERTNVRDLRPEDLPFRPSLLTADLSFISLASVIPSLVACAAPDADVVALVKPQFEAGRDAVGKGGVVTDPGAWRASLESVAGAIRSAGGAVVAAMASPLLGPAGNAEFLVHARLGTGAPGAADLDAAVDEASALRRASA
jgi:23S rRNA (cytidine1920-2'-O)/16S rRNA (cytidine1409-2'-O)-methyltransferase